MIRIANSARWGEAAWVSWHWSVCGCQKVDLAGFLKMPQHEPGLMISEFTEVWSNTPIDKKTRKAITIEALQQYIKDGGVFIEPEPGGHDWDFIVAYGLAREEHAFLLRCEGLSYRDIGTRLGLSVEGARRLQIKFSWRLRWHMRRTKISVSSGQTDWRSWR